MKKKTVKKPIAQTGVCGRTTSARTCTVGYMAKISALTASSFSVDRATSSTLAYSQPIDVSLVKD